MPTTRRRLLARGYNQAELLAREYARARNLPLWTGLVREETGATQVGLQPSERRANVSGAFQLDGPRRVMARHVLLVDDVLTTGATAGAAAQTLVAGGAAHVVLVAFGRALTRSGWAG